MSASDLASGDPQPLDDLRSEQDLRAIVRSPSDLVVRKQLDFVDPHARAFIALSPMVVVASADAEGRADASPRGDPPGVVQVLDERTLLIPERKGNRRIDTLVNITSNPGMGLLILIPGTSETLRVNGRASATSDPALLDRCAVDGKPPKVGILVEVEDVYFHCARSFLRAKLWQPDSWPERSALPTLGTMIGDQVKLPAGAADEIDLDLERSNRDVY